MESGTDDRIPCRCSYLCQHFSPFVKMVPRRTWYNHDKLSSEGKVHHSVRRLISTQNLPAFGGSTSSGNTELVTQVQDIEQPNLLTCFCHVCKGAQKWTQKTIARHYSMERMRDNLVAIPSLSEEYNQEEPLSDIAENIYATLEPEPLSLHEAIMTQIINLQVLLDKSHMSIDSQGEIMQAFFGSFQDQPHMTRSGSLDYKNLSLGRLLSLVGPDWNGDIGGVQAPTTWKQLMKIYKGLGMVETQKWRLCTGDGATSHVPTILKPHKEDSSNLKLDCLCIPKSTVKHRRDCSGCSQKCPRCEKMRKDILSFEYLPIAGILTFMCLSRTLCHAFLELWRNRDAWKGLLKDFIPETIQEFWDGSKIKEYVSFWDPELEWEVPIICPNPTCKQSFRAFPESQRCEELLDSYNHHLGLYSFSCSECFTLVEAPRRTKKGDPRNFAVLGHWDGFQSARTTLRECVTLEIEILNTRKESSLGPIPILFIPASSAKLIKHGDSSVQSAFLEPFISELEILFITGFPVSYVYPPHLISEHLDSLGCIDGKVQLHAMLMAFTGDAPAQCKFGGVKYGGYGGCRRHQVSLEVRRDAATSRANLVYCNTRREVRHPLPLRSCENLLAAACEWRTLQPGKERVELERRSGISGHSSAWRLYHLYGFDISRDLVYDVMHTLSLNILKKYVALLVDSMSALGLFDELEKALVIALKHKPKGLGGRWPRKLKSLGYYKAEEYQLFVMWCLPYILDHLNLKRDSVLGGMGMLLIEVCRLFHSHARRHGWTTNSIVMARTLLAAWRVRVEESIGPSSSPLEHVAGSGELLDDIMRHGCHDIYWCYAFERQVSNYMAIPTNQKSMEVSYLNYFKHYFFTKTLSYIKMDKDGMLPHQRALHEVHKFLFPSRQICTPEIEVTSSTCDVWHGDRVIVVFSQEKARNLEKIIFNLESCTCKSLIVEKGICVGPKTPVVKQATPVMAMYLEEFWRTQGILNNENSSFLNLDLCRISFVLLQGVEYHVNDLVVVRPDLDNTDHSWTWKGKILGFFIHELQGKMQVFFEADYFEQQVQDCDSVMPLVHHISGMRILNAQPRETIIRPVQQLIYKFMTLPIPHKDYLVAFELEDKTPRTHLLEVGQPGCIPPFPELGDIMLVKRKGWVDGDPFLYAIILEVNSCNANMEPNVDIESQLVNGVIMERDTLVGTVELCLLRQMGPRSRKFVAKDDGRYKCSWHELVKQVVAFRVTKCLHGQPIEWMIIS